MAETMRFAATAQPAYRTALCWSAAAAAAVLAIGGLSVSLATDSALALSGHTVEDAVIALMWSGLGLLLALRVRSSPFGALFLGLGLVGSLGVAGGATAAADLGGWSVAGAWLDSWLWVVPTFASVSLVPAWFPDRGWRTERWVTGLAIAGMGTMAAGLATTPRIERVPGESVANPLATGLDGPLFVSGTALVTIAIFIAIFRLIRRLSAATGDRRRQLAPLVAAGIITLPAMLVAVVLGPWGPVLQLVVAPLVPGAVAWVVLRRRLYDLELIVRRSIIFVALSLVVLGGYVLVASGTAVLLNRTVGIPESTLAAAAVALAFQPARAALQRLVARHLYGERDNAGVALADLARRLSSAADPATAVSHAAAALARALRVPWLSIQDQDTVLAVAGERPGWAADVMLHEVTLVHAAETVGVLRVAPREPGVALSARDRRLVDQLAASVAASVAASAHLDELQRSREAIVVAREEERRRLRHDLHDGIGPLLSALTAHADVAALRARRSPETVDEVLDRIRDISADAVRGLRQVIDDLRPAAVDEIGLRPALAELAETLSTPSVAVGLASGPGEAPAVAVERTWSAATQVAIYRIAAEAVTNAVRHADPRRVGIDLRDSDGQVVLEINDDGHGMPATWRAGVGVSSMRERAEQIGGRLLIDTGPAGTVVTAVLPAHGDLT